MTFASPTVILIGGPNGAGKSTIAPALLTHLGVDTFVNADVIARGLSGLNPERRAYQAGRIMLREVRRLAEERATFAFETTLASRVFAPWIRRLIVGGYEFALGYVWVPSPDISVQRVTARVRAGGHGVAEDIVRRRWSRSAINFWNLYLPLAHRWYVYDNSESGPAERIAEGGTKQPERVLNARTWALLKKVQ